ncbi:MAG: TIGR01777 family protein, partial [Desulfobacterales bacterium]|nr:TIGR01777 family protein [Desulfobacterales bacterium]
MKKGVFIKKSWFNAPVEEVFQWHARPGALERLSPPWDPLEVLYKDGGIGKGARVVMKIKAAPLPLKIKWIAEHTDYFENRMFRDRQVKGPFARWIHTHRLEPDGPRACRLEDHIEYALPLPPFGNFFGNALVKNKLERIFRYRHSVLAGDLKAHGAWKDKKPLSVLISGASGVVGSALIPFLTTGGHRALRLVRRAAAAENNEVSWDPAARRLDLEKIRGVNAVVHLSGENIGQGRWTKEKKRRIIESREKSTSLIAKSMASLDPRPDVLICASAIGWYGNRGADLVTEEAPRGRDFISEVCERWEKAAAPALEKGIRVVFLRIGVALSPVGGALERVLIPFKAGFGGTLGSGSQYISWISMDDLIDVIYHAINQEGLEGPVNAVAPNPTTNLEYTKTLGKVLSRPTPLSVPESAIRLAFGQMGEEVVLSGVRVAPTRLLETGFEFRHPELEGALRHMLGAWE